MLRSPSATVAVGRNGAKLSHHESLIGEVRSAPLDDPSRGDHGIPRFLGHAREEVNRATDAAVFRIHFFSRRGTIVETFKIESISGHLWLPFCIQMNFHFVQLQMLYTVVVQHFQLKHYESLGF